MLTFLKAIKSLEKLEIVKNYGHIQIGIINTVYSFGLEKFRVENLTNLEKNFF